jgi:hypothetical protein
MNKLRKRMRLWKENPYCFVCEKNIDDFSEATLEHIIPMAFGGTNSSENIAISHRFCNELKGSLVSKDDWKKKLQEHEKFCRLILWRRSRSDSYIRCLIQKGFLNSAFVVESLLNFPVYYQQTLVPKKEIKFQLHYLAGLRRNQKLDALIEASKHIDLFKTQQYLKIIFGLLFIENYLQTKDIIAILHAIWRLRKFTNNEGSLILYSYSQHLLEFCRNLEPIAYEKYELMQSKRQDSVQVQNTLP